MTLVMLLAWTLGPASRGADLQAPILSVQLEVRAGKVAIDAAATRISQPLPDVYVQCRLAPDATTTDAMKQELVRWLEPQLLGGDKLLTRLVLQSLSGSDSTLDRDAVVRALDMLAKSDAPTRKLWQQGFTWAEGPALVKAWQTARRNENSPLVRADLMFADALTWVLQNPAYADGPLLPRPGDAETPAERARFINGVADFDIAPPLMHTAAKLRPTYNVAQWDAVRSDLGRDVLSDFDCKLWSKPRIEAAVRDYLEVRGIGLQLYRTAGDVKDAGQLGSAVERPSDRAALRLERPEFRDKDFGGRIHLDPDPLLEAVYIQAGPSDGARVERALYLLLPTADFDRIRAAPADYLCQGKAVWLPSENQPSAIQLPLDGSMAGLKGQQLAAARIYLTRAMLAQRLQRLGANALDSRIVMARDVNPPRRGERGGPGGNQRQRLAVLAIEPRTDAPELASQRLPELQACLTPRDAKPAAPAASQAASVDQNDKPRSPDEPPACSADAGDSHCAALDLTPADVAVQPPARAQPAAEATRRNRIEFGLSRQAGKPWRFGAAYRHQGLTPDDTFAIGFGQQKQASGDFSYAGDFAQFARWGRQLQWTARAYATHDPDVGVDASRPDERRKGAEFRVTADLWRAVNAPSAQLGLGLRRVHVSFDGSTVAPQRVSAGDLSFLLTRSLEGTPASPQEELALTATAGRANGETFGKSGATLAMRRFVGPFSTWELRARVHAASQHTPLAEWARFGGEDSVRGYSADRAVAREVWAIQNEYAMPLPWTPESLTWASMLRRSVALAAFIDVGGVTHASSDFSGRKLGAGVGLRYRPDRSVTLRLDAARPVGAATDADRRMRIYFSVTAFTPI